MKIADTILYGFIPGFMFGRMGCTITHDHKGVATDFPLAFNYPVGSCEAADGAWIGLMDRMCVVTGPLPHHNLGFYDLILCFCLWMMVLFASRIKSRPPGTLLAITALTYAPFRFFFEFYRPEASDPRYWGFTPAQWLCILSVLAGLKLTVSLLKGKTRHEDSMDGKGVGAYAEKIRKMMQASAPKPKSK